MCFPKHALDLELDVQILNESSQHISCSLAVLAFATIAARQVQCLSHFVHIFFYIQYQGANVGYCTGRHGAIVKCGNIRTKKKM